MVGKKDGVATKTKTSIASKMFNNHCIYQRFALACANIGDDYKLIRNVEEILI